MYAENLDVKIAECLKNNRPVELSVWRAIKSEFLNFKTAKAGNILTDDVELKIISKMVAQRKESFDQYTNAGRNDLAEKEMSELNILQALLPKEPTNEEIEELVNKFVSDYNNTNNSMPTMKNMKDCMNFVKNTYSTANGGVISNFFKKIIS